ncbi:MAG: hypothetical protein ACI8RZ_002911 [Myxococcota bacterium]|jgi:hypothetical protein
MDRPEDPIIRLLMALHTHGVDYIIVGGAAAVLAGAPVVTRDLDIVHRQTPENIAQLMAVLSKLGAYFRPDPGRRRIPPRASDLAGTGQLNLATNTGELDILCRLSGGHDYDDLLPHTVELQDFDLTLRVLDLPMLIQVKTETNRPKDRLMLPILIAALEERGKE